MTEDVAVSVESYTNQIKMKLKTPEKSGRSICLKHAHPRRYEIQDLRITSSINNNLFQIIGKLIKIGAVTGNANQKIRVFFRMVVCFQ